MTSVFKNCLIGSHILNRPLCISISLAASTTKVQIPAVGVCTRMQPNTRTVCLLPFLKQVKMIFFVIVNIYLHLENIDMILNAIFDNLF